MLHRDSFNPSDLMVIKRARASTLLTAAGLACLAASLLFAGNIL
jgi:hypothetical protein